MQSHHKQWQWRHRWNLMLDALYNAYMNAYVKKKQKHRSTVANRILFFLFYLYRSHGFGFWFVNSSPNICQSLVFSLLSAAHFISAF
jgi:hypothetical protein